MHSGNCELDTSAGVVVGADVLFFENRFWERLIANIGIVALFGAFYLRFIENP